MTTKAQEREALAKIAEIIEGIGGDDSYVGTALKGCLDDAARNIDEDAAYSMADRMQAAEAEVIRLQAKLVDRACRAESMQEACDAERARAAAAEEEREALREERDRLARRCEDYKVDRADMVAELKASRERGGDVVVETADGIKYYGPFRSIKYYDNDGFRFVNVVQASGWTTSYKIDDLTAFEIEA